MKYILIAVIGVLIIGGGLYYFLTPTTTTTNIPPVTETPIETPAETVSTTTEETTSDMNPEARGSETIIGSSVEGNDITAYHYGTGDTELLFIGGTHGGYSFNTALVAYELMDYLDKTPSAIPTDVTVTIIPVLNPDGLKKVVGSTGRFDGSAVTANDATRVVGRFNANNVDLNRNFDCEWKAKGTWQSKEVSGGSAPFSEPETQALRDYVAKHNPSAVVVYYSQAGGVYSSNCKNGVLPETATLTSVYAKASGYTAHEEFDYYEITGDMVNWFASLKIPAISVLLTNHEKTEWSRNLAGVEAVIDHFAN